MRKTKFMAILLCVTMVLSGCGSMNNTTKGGLLGGGGGAAHPLFSCNEKKEKGNSFETHKTNF